MVAVLAVAAAEEVLVVDRLQRPTKY